MAIEIERQPARFAPVASKSRFTVQAFAEGLLSVFAHDPVLSVRDFHGEISFVPVSFENASANLKVKADSLSVASNVKKSDRVEIERVTREEVLEVHKNPEIVFNSTNVSLTQLAEGRYGARVIGDLTLHGVTQRNLWITAEVSITVDALRAKGEFQLRQSDYKIKLVSVAGGTLKVKDEVKCSFDIVARPV